MPCNASFTCVIFSFFCVPSDKKFCFFQVLPKKFQKKFFKLEVAPNKVIFTIVIQNVGTLIFRYHQCNFSSQVKSMHPSRSETAFNKL